ncbi:MAG: VOC family protein [Myxococcales bacterium]|nr:VOC family protein [Myxococcales bacterium]
MRPIQRAFPTLFVSDLQRSRSFYTELFAWDVAFDSDWFVHLTAGERSGIEVALMRRTHALIPPQYRTPPRGSFLTIVVDDVDAVHEVCQAKEIVVEQPPTDEFYGQRRMIIVDPDGTLVDVSSPCDPDPEWLASLS